MSWSISALELRDRADRDLHEERVGARQPVALDVARLRDAVARGIRMTGPADPRLRTIRVVAGPAVRGAR